MYIKELEDRNLKKRENPMTIEKVCKEGLIIVLPIIILGVLVFTLIKGGYECIIESPWITYFKVSLIFIIGVIIHELIHLIILIKGSKDKFKSIRYGNDPEYFKPYIVSEEAITVGQYKLSRLLPLIITAIIPYIFAYVFSSYELMIASMCLFGMCGVDIRLYILIRKENNNKYCIVEEEKYGYDIYE